jgi:hypothetical protein
MKAATNKQRGTILQFLRRAHKGGAHSAAPEFIWNARVVHDDGFALIGVAACPEHRLQRFPYQACFSTQHHETENCCQDSRVTASVVLSAFAAKTMSCARIRESGPESGNNSVALTLFSLIQDPC